MTAHRRYIFIALLFLFIPETVLHAQQVQIFGGPSKEVSEVMNKAQELEQQGKDQEAKALYATLYEKEKNDNVFWHYLLVSERLKDYDTMEKLVKERLAKSPEDPSLLRYMARIIYGRGDKQKSRAMLIGMMDGHWSDVGRAYIVTNELHQQGDLEGMVEVYLHVRRETHNDMLFAPTLASIYSTTTRYIPAIEEYLKQLPESKPIALQIESVIKRAREGGMEFSEIQRPIRSFLDAHPENIDAARILANLLYADGKTIEAYTVIMPASVASNNPKELLNFAARLDADGHFDIALRAYEDFYTRFPNEPERVGAMLNAASLYAGRGEVQKSLDIYKRLTVDYKGTREGDIAELKRIALSEAVTSFDVFSSRLDEFARTSRYPDVSREAYMVLGKTRMQKGLTADAEKAFSQAALAARTPVEKYDIAVGLAYLHFFSGSVETMSDNIDDAIRNNPAGGEINDLLALKVLGIQCAADGSGKTFASFAAGRYALYRGDADSAAVSLMSAASDTSSSAAALASMDLADIYLKKGDTAAAVEWYLKAADAAKDRALKAEALLSAADILARERGGAEQAGGLYRRILIEMPGSVYESEIRRKLLTMVTQ